MSGDETVAELIGRESESSDRGLLSRRGVIGLGVALGVGTLSLLPGSERASASVTAESLTAEGADITTHDGSVDAIEADPVIAVEWEGFNSDSTDVDIEITFDTDEEEAVTPYEQEETLSGTAGEETFDFETVDLLDEGWSASTFEADSDASSETTMISAIVELDAPDAEASAEDTMELAVTNHPAAVQVGGEVTTDLESSEEV